MKREGAALHPDVFGRSGQVTPEKFVVMNDDFFALKRTKKVYLSTLAEHIALHGRETACRASQQRTADYPPMLDERFPDPCEHQAY